MPEWTNGKLGGNFCKKCGHGLGDFPHCQWCADGNPHPIRVENGKPVIRVKAETPLVPKIVAKMKVI